MAIRFKQEILETRATGDRRPVLRAQRTERASPPVRWAVVPLPVLDVLCIILSMTLAYELRFHWLPYAAPVSPAFYTRLVIFTVPLALGIFAVYHLYDVDRLFGGLQEYANVLHACVVGLSLLILYSFVDRDAAREISRGWLAIVYFFACTSIVGARFAYRRLIYHLRARGLFMRRTLIVGANQEGWEVAAQLRASPAAGVQVLGYVDASFRPGLSVDKVPMLGALDSLHSLIEALGVQELIIIPTALQREELLDIYRDWGTDKRLRIYLSSGLYELFTTGVEVKEAAAVPLLSLSHTRIRGMDVLMKTLLDWIGALFGVIVLAPLLLVIAIVTRLDSPGPVVHRRRVIGLHGRTFEAYKFRTMVTGADAYLEAHPDLKREWEETGKIHDDPRITRCGAFLRRYSLDELPQLFNVLKGEMSLVGPRMITPAELTHFGRWQHNLLTVKPGITGLWQVSGRADLSYEERVRLDMRYIRNYTIWMDLRLLLNTVWAVLCGHGAY